MAEVVLELEEVLPIENVQDTISTYRLPNTTRPLRYDVELTTHIHNHDDDNIQFRYEGTVRILIRVLEENVKNFILHQRNITVTHVKLSDTHNNVIVDDDSSFSKDDTYEILVIRAPSPLMIAEYILEIQYYGELGEENSGFYRVPYRDASGATRWIAATQFMPTNARHAFPCYDELGIRAPIGLTLKYGLSYHAITNMPLKQQVFKDNYPTMEFEDTPSMHCGLLAFVVFSYECGFGIRTPQINADSPLIIRAIEEYLDVNSLPNLDLAGIRRFSPGAMENWCSVTFCKEEIIGRSLVLSMSQRKHTAIAVGHEHIHRFFGNLVSPAKWEYLWLSEGLAVLMQYIAAHEVYPEYRILEMITVEVVQKAFQSDALETTRPMNSSVGSPSMALFDDIVYDKSCSVLRQLQHALGDSIFRAGIKYYLAAKQLQSATPDDLAEGLQRSTDEQNALPPNVRVLDVVNSWANQKGYPLLHVSRGSDGVIKLSQKRYRLKPSDDADNATWYLPYNMATTESPSFSSTTPHGWLSDETAELPALPNWDNKHWVIFNKQQTGYYRVNYDNNLWELIIHELHHDHSSIHHLNRAQLIDDSLNLARSGHLNYDVALRLLQYMKKEQEYVPWAAFNNGMSYLNRMMAHSAKYYMFKKYIWKLVKRSVRMFRLENKPNDSHFTQLTRNIIINWACQADYEEYQMQASAKLDAFISDPTVDIEPNLKSVVYCNGLRIANPDTFNFMLNHMKSLQDPWNRLELINALGCSKDPNLLQLYLATSLEEASYSTQERSRVLRAVYTNGKIGLMEAMKFLGDNVETINRLYNSGTVEGRAIETAVFEMGTQVVSQEEFDKFEEMKARLGEQYRHAEHWSRAKEVARENVQWANKNCAVIGDWLGQNGYSISLLLHIIAIAMTLLMLIVLFVGKMMHAIMS